MQSAELKKLRERLGLDRLQFARLIGYTGTDRNDEMRVRKYETKLQVPLHIARFAWLLEIFYTETGRLPLFPDWVGYEFSHEPDQQHRQDSTDA